MGKHGADLGLFCAVVAALDPRYPKRAATPEMINAMLPHLTAIEELYEAAPVVLKPQASFPMTPVRTKERIVINGREHLVASPIHYQTVVALSGVKATVPSVTYSRADSNPHEGILYPDQPIAVRDGTVFSVADTSNA